MTTIVGLTCSEPKAVILASDECSTGNFLINHGGVETREQYRVACKKINISKDNIFAAAASGTYDLAFKEFMYQLTNNDLPLDSILTSGRFNEFLGLNGKRWEWKDPICENENSMLIASRFGNNPILYTCFPLGCVEPRDFTAIGSGSPYALKFINEKKPPRPITLKEGIELVIGSIEAAHRDIYTQGLDMVIVRADRIIPCGEIITSAVKIARTEFMTEIKSIAYQNL
ncbi:MAG: hypothetical protein V1866_01615 [archaeon]